MTERLQRPFTQPPNTVNRRVSLINGVTRHEAAWEGPKGLLASLTVSLGRAQIALVGGSLVADAEGSTVRAAYREAWRELRLARHDTADLLRHMATYRRRWLDAASRAAARQTIIDNQNDAIRGHLAQHDLDAEKLAEVLAENTALKAQTVQQAQDMQALRDQLAAAQRAPEDVSEKVQTLEKRVRALQGKLTAALAHQATTQGHYDELRKQHGLPTSADLAVNAARPASFAGESAAPVVGEAHS